MRLNWKEPENIDLRRIAERLRVLFLHQPPLGYLNGKTSMRNALEDCFQLSELDAEELIDTLESRGFVRYEGDPSGAPEIEDVPWAIESRRSE
jgi:hypothetical protein